MSLAVAKKGAITSTGPSAWRPAVVAIAILLVLAVLPSLVDPYQTVLLTYGLIMAIAALGFNLLLGYTGLLSFGHSAYFGAGAYTVAFIVRDLGAQSMELCIVGGLLGTLLISALFGFVCVRHTRIFFSILTLALSQVLWSLAFKFFWVTGGTDGIRVASAKLTLLGGLVNFAGPGSFQRFVFAYYYYVLGLFALATVVMWVVVHSPFGKALQAIRHIGRVHGPGRCPLGSAQWTDHARHPLLAVLRRDRVHERARRVSDVHRADRRRRGVQLSQDLCGREHGILAAPARRGARGPGVSAAVGPRGDSRAPCRQVYQGDLMSLLETVHLKKYFGDTHAVDDVNLTIEKGEFISLVGPNGAGKTSFCNVVSAYYSADSGKIIFQGEDVSNASVTQRVKAGIARSFQLVNLFDDLTAFDNVALAIFSREGKTRNIAALARRDSEVTREADAVLNQFGLAGKRNELARGLAQGERKLLDVALAYALRPKLLFLDEPTSGVSTRDKGHIMDTIASVVRGEGITAVVIEHDMDVVFKYSDRLVVMHQGAILAQGTPAEIRKNEQVAMILIGSSGPDAFSRKD